MRIILFHDGLDGMHGGVNITHPHDALQAQITLTAMREGLSSLGHEVISCSADDEALLSQLPRMPADVLFNLCTGVGDRRRQLHTLAWLETLPIPRVGSNLMAQTIALHKTLTKVLLVHHGIPTPDFLRIMPHRPLPLVPPAYFPLLIKPALSGSSLGITPESIVTEQESFERRALQMLTTFRQELVAERLLSGREFTVGVLGNDCLEVFPIEEIAYRNWPMDLPKIYSFQAKVEELPDRICPASVDSDTRRTLEGLARDTFHCLALFDYARIDIRLDAQGKAYVLEVNAMPGLQPGYSEYPQMAEQSGRSYPQLLEELAQTALIRYATA